MMKLKLFLYCTDVTPYLLCEPYMDKNKPCRLLRTDIDKTIYNCVKETAVNGKVVAECDFEIEEHDETTIDWLCMSLREKIIFSNMCKKANIDELECYKYANGKPLYAIHLKDLHIFNNPRELSNFNKIIETTYGEEPDTPITKAPQNMMRCCYEKKPKEWETGVLISIQPKELCRILNGEQTILINKQVLNCMKGNK